MLLWIILYFFAFISALCYKKYPNFFIISGAIISTADMYGVRLFEDLTFTPFSLFAFIISIIFVINLRFYFLNFIKILSNNLFYYFIIGWILLLFITFFSELILTDNNTPFSLVFRPLLVSMQWFFITVLYIIQSERCNNNIKRSFINLCYFVSFFTLFVVIYQLYGFDWVLPYSSSTYDFYGEMIFGGATRPNGLSREPAHLIVPCMAILSYLYKIRRYLDFFIIFILWILIGFYTETRSIQLLSILFVTLLILFDAKIRILNKFYLIIIILLAATIYSAINERFISSFNIYSDESTSIRYSLLISSAYSFISDLSHFNGLASSSSNFCTSSYEFLEIENFLCGKYEGMILNSTLNFMVMLPYGLCILFIFYYIITCYRSSGIIIIAFLFSGIVLYQWAYPAVGLYILLNAKYAKNN